MDNKNCVIVLMQIRYYSTVHTQFCGLYTKYFCISKYSKKSNNDKQHLTVIKYYLFLQVKHLSRIKGFGQKDVIKNIMQQVLTDDLAIQFNWQGRGDKKPFAKLILTDVIRGKHTAA